MPPQPISTRRRSLEYVIGFSATIENRPELSLKATECIASYSELETTMANTLAALLGANATPAIAMYDAVLSAK